MRWGASFSVACLLFRTPIMKMYVLLWRKKNSFLGWLKDLLVRVRVLERLLLSVWQFLGSLTGVVCLPYLSMLTTSLLTNNIGHHAGLSFFQWLSSCSSSSPSPSPALTWSATTRSPSSRFSFGYIDLSNHNKPTLFRWQTFLSMRTLPLSWWQHNMSSDIGDPQFEHLNS